MAGDCLMVSTYVDGDGGGVNGMNTVLMVMEVWGIHPLHGRVTNNSAVDGTEKKTKKMTMAKKNKKKPGDISCS